MIDLEMAKLKLQRGVLAISLDLPFYAGLMLSMPGGVILDETCDTAWTDGNRIGFSPKLVLELTPYGIKFVLVHEICHVMMKHHLRKGIRNHDKWNRAADYVIHDNMFEDNWKILDWVLYDTKWSNMTTEMVYSNLSDNPADDKCGGTGGSGTTSGEKPEGLSEPGHIGEVREMKNEDGSEMSDADKAAAATEVDIQVSQAMTQARAAGTGTVGQERFCKDLLESRVDWKTELRQYLESFAKEDYNWSMPNRRYIAAGLYMPTLKSEKMKDMVFFIDTSGSVTAQELQQFMSEVAAILDIFNVCVHVVYVDTKVHSPQEFNSREPWDISAFKPAGFGGTDFRPGFEWVEENGIDPCVAVYLTDMDCSSFPEQAPDYDVLWVGTNPYYKDRKVPFGKFINIGEW